MKRILIAAVLVGALVQAGAASAGCMATVGLAPPPTGIAPGTTWTAEMTILQHGLNALPNADTARPTLTIVNSETGVEKTFAARATQNPEVFVAKVAFPTAGTWSYVVYDDFSSEGGHPVPCAQTHSFAALAIGGPAGGSTPSGPSSVAPEPVASTGGGDGFPFWPVVIGVIAALALAIVLLRWRPRRESVA